MTANIIWKDETASVLDDLRAMALEGAPAWTAVAAGRQTAGRGQRGRVFLSEPGGLYFAVLLRPDGPAAAWMPLTCLAALAVCDAAEAVTGVRPAAKWPNDIVWNGKKLCGILTEGRFRGGGFEFILCGIGLNAAQESFPPELEDIAVSLRQAGYTVTPPQMLDAVLSALEAVLREDRTAALNRYRKDCATLGGPVEYEENGRLVTGTAADIDECGRLAVRLADGAVCLWTQAPEAGRETGQTHVL